MVVKAAGSQTAKLKMRPSGPNLGCMPGELAAKCTESLPLDARLSARLTSTWMFVAARSEAPLILSPPPWALWAHSKKSENLKTSGRSDESPFLEQLRRVCSSFGVLPERCTLRLRAGRFAGSAGDNDEIERFLAIAPVLPPELATTLEIAEDASVSHQSIEHIVRLASVLPRLTELRIGGLVLSAEHSERLLSAVSGPLGPLGPLAKPTALLVLDVCLRCNDLRQLISTLAALTELRALRLCVACHMPYASGEPADAAWSLTHAVLAMPRLLEFELAVTIAVV